jgi:TetR/AcrR family transcriptional regulator, regulator of autoinduction and epiphytic fitness
VSRRTYDSTRRRKQAEATRTAVLDAGRTLFADRGYAATTVADIAIRAGVAPATVNAAFGGKAGLLKRLIDIAIAGDDEPIPVSEREIARQVAAEPDPRRQIALLVASLTKTHERLAELHDVVAQASGTDEDVRTEMVRGQQRRRQGMAEFVAYVDPQLLAVDAETAADIVWALTEPRLYLGLVRERGWAKEQYERWLCQQLEAALLRPA